MIWQPKGTILCEIWIMLSCYVYHQSQISPRIASLWYRYTPPCVLQFTVCPIDYSDVIMTAMASKITGVSIVFWIVFSRCRWKKISKLRVTGLCEGNPPVIGGFASQRASKAENVSIWWRHHIYMSITQWAPWIKSNHSLAQRDGYSSCCWLKIIIK